MPRFYFHVRAGQVLEHDAIGVEFASLNDAKSDAEVAAREMLVDKALAGQSAFNEQFEIADETGTVVAIVPLMPTFN